jgi:hypothetical protein
VPRATRLIRAVSPRRCGEVVEHLENLAAIVVRAVTFSR